MKEKSFHEKVDIDNELKLREQLMLLPHFCREYFIGIEPTTSSRTRIAYAYDLGIFFNYLKKANPIYEKKEIQEFSLQLLDEIRSTDIEEYLNFLKYYEKNGAEHTNKERGLTRKLASLRSFYNYFYRSEKIRTNPAELVKMPKNHEKNIVRLEIDEIASLLDIVESGEQLTQKQKIYHQQTKKRDLALLTLLLGTGIRVSECVGIDMEDIDFKNNGLRIYRKGGSESIVYFGNEVESAIKDYLIERKSIIAAEGSKDALFLSMQKKRISVRTVENLVKKYSRLVTALKNITPHKLRSTYGTSLYRETGDIYLVADVLGHKDVNTTKKHYAAIAEDQRKLAAKYVQLREPKNDER